MSIMATLARRRKEIISEISGIKSMRKGQLNAQYQNITHKNGEKVVKGPYYVLTKKGENGKTISQAVPKEEAERIQAEVDNYKLFRQLSDEYIDICDQISVSGHRSNSEDEGKKN